MADILRIQNEAKDRGFDSAIFYISAPKGVFEAKWLDAYFGLFEMAELGDGFVSVNQMPSDWEAFWDKAEAERHNEVFAPLRELASKLEAADRGESDG